MLRTEQRSHPRITTRITLQSIGPTLNISAGGMCVLTADPLHEGVAAEIDFELPDTGTVICCKSRVAWCRPSKIDPELFEIGLSFVEISDQDRQAVMDFVDAHLSPQPQA